MDLLTLDEAKDILGISQGESRLDDRVGSLVASVSGTIAQLCGPVVATEVAEYHDDPWSGELLLRQTPVLSVDAVTEFASDGTPTPLNADTDTVKQVYGFQPVDLDGHNARIYLTSSGGSVGWGGRVLVEYTAGRAATIDDVPDRFKGAARSILARAWRQDAPSWARTQDLADPDVDGGAGYLSVDYMVRFHLERDLLPPTIL